MPQLLQVRSLFGFCYIEVLTVDPRSFWQRLQPGQAHLEMTFSTFLRLQRLHIHQRPR